MQTAIDIFHALQGSYPEDVVQEVVCRFLEHPEVSREPLHWARRTAKHLMIDQYRRRQVSSQGHVWLRLTVCTTQAPLQSRRMEARDALVAISRHDPQLLAAGMGYGKIFDFRRAAARRLVYNGSKAGSMGVTGTPFVG